jgi:glycosyltransferase involved in cell wall biosynthesis
MHQADKNMVTIIWIIIPFLNEANFITHTLSALQPLRAKGHEVIVVDGGSEDASLTQSQPLADRVIRSPRGRSRQMNAGAQIARGEILLFLHADTFLPEGADRLHFKMKQRKDLGTFRCSSLRQTSFTPTH